MRLIRCAMALLLLNAGGGSLARAADGEPLRPGVKVTFRDDLTFLVNGQPCFPIGLYYASEEIADVSGASLAQLRAEGFNYIFYHGEPNTDELDRIARAGLFVMYRPTGALWLHLDRLPALVDAVRHHPALLVWEMDDEPTYNRVDFEKTKTGCAILRQRDPDHPISVCHQAKLSIEELRRWGELADVNGFNFYPVPPWRWKFDRRLRVSRRDASIGIMGRFVEEWQSHVPGKPVLPVLQAFSHNPLNPLTGFPTAAQGRFMVYQVVIAGAKGISFYGRRRVSSPFTPVMIPPAISPNPEQARADFEKAQQRNHEFWEQFLPVIREAGDLAPVFAARDADWRAVVDAGTVESRVKQLENGAWVILLVNNSGRKTSARIKLPAAVDDQTVHSWTTGESFRLDGTALFHDRLESFAVRAYSNRPRRDALRGVVDASSLRR